MFLLAILKNILLAALGERVVAKAFFGLADWLADQSATNIDDEIVTEWRKAYYGEKLQA
ncbi:hypothetical protein [Amphritea sp. HPY]|uniref:hypothetical protein n=1 Tax=Amphritea sp. HPY TaxID=3421652 RepID=UPI003D7E5F2B